ncbi:MAG: aspartate--tRNA ligase, partial [Alphaproteobacteria bacterium]|nr:aspartate--tRNA ligase [Alphaproteobacteria bacterium]
MFEPDGPVDLGEARELKREYVVAVAGKVRERPEGLRNKNLPTGGVEVVASELRVLNRSETPPFVIEEEVDATDEMRLTYRFLDLRREGMSRRIVQRSVASQAVR